MLFPQEISVCDLQETQQFETSGLQNADSITPDLKMLIHKEIKVCGAQ